MPSSTLTNMVLDGTTMIAGLGVSGMSAQKVLTDAGYSVVTVDDKKPADYTFADVLAPNFDFSAIDYVVTSPGFAPASPFLTAVAEHNIEILSEVELAWRMRVNRAESSELQQSHKAQWIGITGTNGKTSTTEMTSTILRSAGFEAPAVGNIGDPVSAAAVDSKNDVLVVELSSFQLHYTDSLELDCAAITNLADDHLDWHGGFDNYASDKAKVYNGVKKALVYNADDVNVTERALAAQPAEGCIRVGFTLNEPQRGQIGVSDGWIVDNSDLNAGRIVPVQELTYLCEPDGSIYPHLLADALCALALTLGLGVDAHTAAEGLKTFAPGGHRIQEVARLATPEGPIRFIDDSKATNAHAAAASLSSFADNSVVWIAGGLAKGAHFGQLVRNQKHKIKAAVIIGKDQSEMLSALDSEAPEMDRVVIDPADNDSVMRRAVDAAADFAQGNDVVLMAPACASMDQFVSYADRGNQFAEQSQRLVNERLSFNRDSDSDSDSNSDNHAR